jgi:uncharacterized circularly permuted ATP-grasp superfamily protein/uncharacterized alpha-E superfamily protein
VTDLDPTPDRPAEPDLLHDYAVPAGHLDEIRDPSGEWAPAWGQFMRHAGALTATRLERAQTRIARQLRENGVTYTVYADHGGHGRPWAVDALPLVVPAAEWEALARGLRQRARLLNTVAADLYGAQRLLTEGILPPALVFGHPGFLRACHGVTPPGGVLLHQVAFDLGRGPDRRWRIVGTRTQAVSGAGYALENRITVSRLFPDAFRELRVHVLAPFFRTLKDTLLAAAPRDAETPHIVLLTPGPFNETYFEHAYLARYLGFPLVEGGDLTVRDDRVYLKTVTGLRRVHAILRRMDDDYCDPLELRADSTLGVPGLVQAWRAGQVVVANAFGTSVLESPALLPYLPAAAERLLGERLEVPAIDTWWCGEVGALDVALARLSQSVIKRAFPDVRKEAIFGQDLDGTARAAWIERLRARPDQYVLEEYVPLSHAPAWGDGRLEPRALMLRVFLAADGRGDYRVMPGGLARIAGSDRQIVSGQRGGSSKDIWALSDMPVEPFSLLPGRLSRADIAQSERMVSSRAAEHLFWLGRYAERAENCGRLLRAVLSRLPDTDGFPQGLPDAFVRTCRRQGLLPPRAGVENGNGHEREPDPLEPGPLKEHAAFGHAEAPGAAHAFEAALIEGLFDADAQSLAFNITQAARVAGAVRDRLSSDNWRLLNQLAQSVARPPAQPPGLSEALDMIDRTIISLVAVGGLEMAHMTRDDGWRFLSLGRHLERLLYVATTVAEVANPADAESPALLEWLLDLSDSIITYRARYLRQPEWLPVAELLLFDGRNPRSAAFQLGKLAKHVRLLPEADLSDLVTELDRAVAVCRSDDTTQGHLFGGARALDLSLRVCENLALKLSDGLAGRYFSHVHEAAHSTSVL